MFSAVVQFCVRPILRVYTLSTVLSVGRQNGAQAKWNDTECALQEALAAEGEDMVRPAWQEEDQATQETKEGSRNNAASRGGSTPTHRPLPNLQVQLSRESGKRLHA